MSWFVPTLSSRVPSSKLTPLLSVNGMKLTMLKPWARRRVPKLRLRRSPITSNVRSLLAKPMPRSTLFLMINSLLVASMPRSPPALVNLVAATVTSWKDRNSSSTSASLRLASKQFTFLVNLCEQ